MGATPSVLTFPSFSAHADAAADDAPLCELVAANRQRDALYRLSEQLARAVSEEAIHAAALTAIEAALDCDRSSILLFDDSDTMQFVAWHGLSAGYRAAVAGHSPWRRDDAHATPIAIEDIASAALDPALKTTILDEGIHAAAFIPVMADGALIGKFMAYFRTPHALTRDDLSVAHTIARQLGFAIQRQRAEARLRAHEAELAEELAATRALQALSIEIAHEIDLAGFYAKLLDAATGIMRAEFASMQEYHAHRGPVGELWLLAHRGFTDVAANFWQWVRADSGCTCAVAYRALRRVIVPDVDRSELVAGTEDLAQYRAVGIRAVQSTPLLSRSGQLLGMISTHWKNPHVPTERDLRRFDILARLAADVIERKRHDEDLRRREERSRTLTQLLVDVPWHARSDGAFETLQPAWENYTGQSWDAHAGHGWLEAVHPEDRDAMRTTWANACFEARPYECATRLWHARSGEYRHCLIRATPIRNEDGSVREWVGACLDVHTQRAARD
jgi:PAS domain S-box-containing protein